MNLIDVMAGMAVKGGPGSGHWGHAGRPGHVGGSMPSDGVDLTTIMDRIDALGGSAYFVGGAVRDRVLGVTPKDADIEVFGVSADDLTALLRAYGRVDAVGVSFGILKFTGVDASGGRIEADFSLPRRESKAGRGHRGFMVTVDDGLTPTEAAQRRDFTINSLYADRDGNIFDPFGGLDDLAGGVLRHTSPAFADDPLRVLRGMQFAGRFDMTMAPETVALARSLRGEYADLSKERIWGEWEKWATKSVAPSRGISVLYRTGWLSLYPEIAALVGVPQDTIWHPEGSVFVHTKHVVDAAAHIAMRDGLGTSDRADLLFAALCHDLGKPQTTEFVDGRWRAHGHAEAGDEPTRSFLRSIGAPDSTIDRVVFYVRAHMAHTSGDGMSSRSLRRLAARASQVGATMPMLARVIEADASGRPPIPVGLPRAAIPIRDFSESVAPILMGRHLIAAGYKPGSHFGPVLRDAYEKQLDGDVRTVEEGLEFARAALSARISK